MRAGAPVSKNAMKLLHHCDGLCAEASESIGGDALDVAVLMQVTRQRSEDMVKTGLEQRNSGYQVQFWC